MKLRKVISRGRYIICIHQCCRRNNLNIKNRTFFGYAKFWNVSVPPPPDPHTESRFVASNKGDARLIMKRILSPLIRINLDSSENCSNSFKIFVKFESDSFRDHEDSLGLTWDSLRFLTTNLCPVQTHFDSVKIPLTDLCSIKACSDSSRFVMVHQASFCFFQ